MKSADNASHAKLAPVGAVHKLDSPDILVRAQIHLPGHIRTTSDVNWWKWSSKTYLPPGWADIRCVRARARTPAAAQPVKQTSESERERAKMSEISRPKCEKKRENANPFPSMAFPAVPPDITEDCVAGWPCATFVQLSSRPVFVLSRW